MQNMQLEIDLLKETISVLKKDPGIDQTALKDRYSLSVLLEKLSFPKSSYYYQEASLKQEDKYNDIRKKITKLFYENKGCYGYRRIYGLLKRKGILIYEKIVLRLMHEEDFVVKNKRRRKYQTRNGLRTSPNLPFLRGKSTCLRFWTALMVYCLSGQLAQARMLIW
jgi:putative transposase